MVWEILDLQHPVHQDWKPRLHPEILSEIARGFHLLGGRGALRRWQSTLNTARPRAGVNTKQREQKLEECQWWISCISNWLYPTLSGYDKNDVTGELIGCSTGEQLPLPNQPKDVVGWINSCLSQIDWATLASRDELFSNTLPGLQNFTCFSQQAKRRKYWIKL